jgi:hypothetical protein
MVFSFVFDLDRLVGQVVLGPPGPMIHLPFRTLPHLCEPMRFDIIPFAFRLPKRTISCTNIAIKENEAQ